MSGEFITSFKMVSAEFDTTAMRAFKSSGKIHEICIMRKRIFPSSNIHMDYEACGQKRPCHTR